MSAIKHLTSQDFDETVNSAKLPLLVDFWAEWCGPCRMLAPVLEELSGELNGKAEIAKVDIDDEADIAARFGVMSIPTLVLFKDGKAVKKQVGLSGSDLLQSLKAFVLE